MESIELRVNAIEVIALPGLGSAGYRWRVSIDPPGVVSVASEIASAVPRAPGTPGASHSRDELFRLTGLRAGRAVVRFTQTRAFEPHAPPHEVRNIEVSVIETDRD